MSITEILINLSISLVAGVLTTLIFTSSASTGSPPIVYIKEIHYEKNSKPNLNHKSSNSFNYEFWTFIAVSVLVTLSMVFFLAKYRELIIVWGWRMIALSGAIAITSLITSFIKKRKIEFIKVWTMLCWGAIVYIFWSFNNPQFGPEYFNYLNSIKSGASPEINDFSFSAAYQVIGLVLLVGALLSIILQELLILLWPISYNNYFFMKLSPILSIFISNNFLAAQLITLVFSYLFCSGILIQFINNNFKLPV